MVLPMLVRNLRTLALWLTTAPSASVIFSLFKNTLLRSRARKTSRGQEANLRTENVTEDWFSENVPHLTRLLNEIPESFGQIKVLEIGAFEGLSTLYFASHPRVAEVAAVDNWRGPDFQEYPDKINWLDTEARFDDNTRTFENICKIKSDSALALSQLKESGDTFDLIYIDGSHFVQDVLKDGLLAWPLLSNQGHMIFDDYLWFGYSRARDNVAYGVHALMRILGKRSSKVVFAGRQVIIQKFD